MSVRLRLSAFLESNKISQKEISGLLGKKAGTISGIISGKSKITTDQLVILASHFNNLDLRWLLTGEEYKISKLDTRNLDYNNNEESNVANEPCPCCEKLKNEKMALLEKLDRKSDELDKLNAEYRHLLETGHVKKENASTNNQKAG